VREVDRGEEGKTRLEENRKKEDLPLYIKSRRIRNMRSVHRSIARRFPRART
jgi:hypothetical protein